MTPNWWLIAIYQLQQFRDAAARRPFPSHLEKSDKNGERESPQSSTGGQSSSANSAHLMTALVQAQEKAQTSFKSADQAKTPRRSKYLDLNLNQCIQNII